MAQDTTLTRKQILTSLAAGIVMTASAGLAKGQTGPTAPVPTPGANPVPSPAEISVDDLRSAAKLIGLTFSDEELAAVLKDVQEARQGFGSIRALTTKETAPVPLAYSPDFRNDLTGTKVKAVPSKTDAKRPSQDEAIAFLSVRELGHLIHSRQISSFELTRIYLNRLKLYGEGLLCVASITEELALRQAENADRDLQRGIDRGPLHGIPFGAKDLFATKSIPTAWGADPFVGQVFDYDAAVIERLRAAGAILVAKLSMGALAQGDVWYRGMTKNPWNRKQGSSGSSAGSAAATAAGLVGFAIGTETSGSILSPSLRCRVTGLRPTFGRVSRFGAMELCFSLDRVGPICREAEDTALVLAVLCGSDSRDPSAVDRPFEYPQKPDLKRLKIGWTGPEKDLDSDPAVQHLRPMGVTIEEAKFVPFESAIYSVLDVEAASAFDAFTRGNGIHQLKNSSWPNTFRAARFVPGVEYLQALRARATMTRDFNRVFADYDFLLGPGLGGDAFAHANFSGFPAIHVPFGDDGAGNSLGRTLVAKPYEEAALISLAKVLQDAFGFHRKHPVL